MNFLSVLLSPIVVVALLLLPPQISGDGDHAAHIHSSTTTTGSDGVSQTVSQTQTSSSGGEVPPPLGNPTSEAIAKYLESNPALAAAAAAAFGGYEYAPPPATSPPATGGGWGASGGGHQPGGVYGIPWGFGKGFNLNVDAGAGLGGLGTYYPVIEKIIAVVGGGILILLILAFLQGSVSPGGFLHALGGSFSKAIAGSATVDLGPIHKSAAGAASFNLNNGLQFKGGQVNDPAFNERVSNSFDRRF